MNRVIETLVGTSGLNYEPQKVKNKFNIVCRTKNCAALESADEEEQRETQDLMEAHLWIFLSVLGLQRCRRRPQKDSGSFSPLDSSRRNPNT
jgi:hypothetical protein